MTMSSYQLCEVCGEPGRFVVDPISMDPEPEELVIGQCPRCYRFICSQHGEVLSRSPPGRLASPVLCCPFDPGIVLNVEDSTYLGVEEDKPPRREEIPP